MATIVQGMPTTPVLPRPRQFTGVWSWITTVDHKRIGILYGVTAFAFFLIGGIEALLIRLQLAVPDNTLIRARHLQPAVHDARHHHDLPGGHAAERGLLQHRRALTDRRPRRRLPAAERPQLLDLPDRRHLPEPELARRRGARTRAGSATRT